MITAAVALATGIAVPALAQETATEPATNITVPTAPATNSADAVGPAQLRDFSLQGTVTRRADTPASTQPQEAAPGSTTAGPATAGAPTQSADVAPAPGVQRRAPAAVAPRPGSAPAQAAGAAADPFAFTPSKPSGEASTFTPAPVTSEPASIPDSVPLAPPPSDLEGNLLARWPWLLALLAAAGAAVWYFRRQRSGYAFAGAGADASAFEPSPAPSPPVRPMPPAPRPAAAPAPEQRGWVPKPQVQPTLPQGLVSTRLGVAADVATEVRPEPAPAPVSLGVVSTSLRPWLDLELAPSTAVIDDEKAVVQFDITVFNSGSAPARDVLIEAILFNAGPDQDEEIASFFASPVAEGERIPLIPPLQRMSFRSTATIRRDQVRVFEAGERKVFVPIIGFNALYRWSAGEGQTSASYILGRDMKGEKMAPFILADGARTFNGVGAREHTVRVRK